MKLILTVLVNTIKYQFEYVLQSYYSGTKLYQEVIYHANLYA